MTLQSSQRLPELLFYTKKSYKILQAPIPAPIPAPMLHMHITLQSREFSIQNLNSTYRRQRALRVLLLHTEGKGPSFQKRNSTHRRQGDLLEMHPCVLQDLPMTFQTFQPFQAILQCSSISRESTPFQHSPIRMHILHILQFDWFPENSTEYQLGNYKHYSTNIHSSKKGRCCDIGQIDRFSIIELFPLLSCQVIILIARMTFNCSTSCLMS